MGGTGSLCVVTDQMPLELYRRGGIVCRARVFPWMQDLRKRQAGKSRGWECYLQKEMVEVHGDLLWNGKKAALDD